MEKTAVFLLSSAPYLIDYYHLEHFRRNYALKLILLVRDGLFTQLSEKCKSTFDKIYQMPPEHIDSYNTILNADMAVDVLLAENIDKNAHTKIFTYNEFNLPLAVQLREKFDIKGHRSTDIENFRDKVTTKTILKKNDIKIPEFVSFALSRFINNAENYYHEIANKIGTPFILKPINTSGSYGVLKINNLKEFLSINKTLPIFEYTYEAEAFIKGDLYHCDAYFKNQQIVTIKCAKYSYPLLEFGDGKNIGSIPLLQDNPIAKKLIKFHNQVHSVLQPPDGITHTEIFIEEKNTTSVFLETSLRPAGAYIIPMYERSFGLNLLSLDFSEQMGFEYYIPNKEQCYSFWASFPKTMGKVVKLIKPSIRSQYDLTWHIREGEQLSLAKSMRDKAAAFFAWNQNYQDLWHDFNYISNNMAIKTA